MTLQALSEEDRRQWLEAMDGREPVYSPLASGHPTHSNIFDSELCYMFCSPSGGSWLPAG